MSPYTETITVQISLTAYGDALIFGSADSHSYVPGVYLKHRLFAWHEASFYGTELAIQTVQDVELIMLPSELVIPFFAKCKLLEHVQWVWGDDAAKLIQLAPFMEASIEDKHYEPSFSAFRQASCTGLGMKRHGAFKSVKLWMRRIWSQASGMGLVPHSQRLYSVAIMERKQPPLTCAENIRSCLQERARLPQA